MESSDGGMKMPLLQLLSSLSGLTFFWFAHVTGRSAFPKPLKADEERAFVERMLAGDGEAKKGLIEHNMRLVAHIAKKYINAGADQEDLVSIGSIGLIKAVSSFRPEKGKLTAYASRCIENEILMHLRSNKKNRRNLSLTDPIGADQDGNEIVIMDLLGTDADMVAQLVETNIESARVVKLINECLTKRERVVMLLRYGIADGVYHPQHEIAKALGISRSYVSRIEKKALLSLQKAMKS
jgi:RNA polymerase sporulation-specific sigma factor